MPGFEKHALPMRERAITSPLLEEIDVLKLELEERDAMLDGILVALHRMDGPLYDGNSAEVVPYLQRHFNAAQAGVTWADIDSWWADHKAKDRVRKEQEAQERERRRQEILSRLTAEERDILGIKE